jgi:hypothetical protein
MVTIISKRENPLGKLKKHLFSGEEGGRFRTEAEREGIAL